MDDQKHQPSNKDWSLVNGIWIPPRAESAEEPFRVKVKGFCADDIKIRSVFAPLPYTEKINQ
jgi:hypothetical protein